MFFFFVTIYKTDLFIVITFESCCSLIYAFPAALNCKIHIKRDVDWKLTKKKKKKKKFVSNLSSYILNPRLFFYGDSLCRFAPFKPNTSRLRSALILISLQNILIVIE